MNMKTEIETVCVRMQDEQTNENQNIFYFGFSKTKTVTLYYIVDVGIFYG